MPPRWRPGRATDRRLTAGILHKPDLGLAAAVGRRTGRMDGRQEPEHE